MIKLLKKLFCKPKLENYDIDLTPLEHNQLVQNKKVITKFLKKQRSKILNQLQTDKEDKDILKLQLQARTIKNLENALSHYKEKEIE